MVELLYISPLWLISNGIRQSHDTTDKADSYWLISNQFKCPYCGSDKTEVSLSQYECNVTGVCLDCEANLQIHIGEKDYDLIKRVGFKFKHCYSEDTEVLTKNGWKLIKEVNFNDEIITLNPKTNYIEYHKPTRLFKYEHNDEMIHFKSRNIDLIVTKNHKLWVAKDSSKNRKYDERKFELDYAINFLDKRHYQTVRSNGVYGSINYNNNLMKLIGFFIGDGYMNLSYGKQIKFHIKKERKIKFIKDLTINLGFSLTKLKNNQYAITINNKETLELFKACYTDRKEKTIPRKILFNAMQENLKNLMYGYLFADGDYKLLKRGIYEATTTSKRLVDDLQSLAVLVGYGFTKLNFVPKREDVLWKNGKITKKENIKELFTFRILTKKLDVRFNNSNKEPKPEIIKYNGYIYSLEVPNHIIMVRRNEKMVWSGNSSVLEHSLIVFEFEASRALLQELSRHRIGVSPTIKSTRYTLKELRNEKSFITYGEVVGENVATHYDLDRASKYVVLTDDDTTNAYIINALERVKWLIQENRSNDIAKYALPEAYKFKGQVSFNLRSLLHLLKLRIDKSALKEFRLLCKDIIDSLPPEWKELILLDEQIKKNYKELSNG